MVNPKHVAIIMDGNRRWAKKYKKSAYEGHLAGAKRLEDCMKWCKQYGIKELTVYALSIPNLGRSKEEIGGLFKIFEDYLNKLLRDNDKHLCIKFAGDLVRLPQNIQDLINKVRANSVSYKPYKLTLCLAYDGREEIFRALKKNIKLVGNYKELVKYLDVSSEPDLVIRTGGSRLSGFLTWQNAYSELIFLPNKLWPAFIRRDFINCILEFQKRRRTYGR